MKKATILLIVLTIIVMPLVAQDSGISKDREIRTLKAPPDGRAKIGLLIGYPSGVTFGYQFSNWFEANITGGYNLSVSKSGIISANGLFTLVNIPVGDSGLMPLSLGPQVNFILGSKFYIDIVADLRLQYTFPNIPLNLFGEFGFGFRFFNDGDWWAWNGGLGVRYVF